MYDIIDNFLPESEFKEIKEWANSQPFPSQQDWSPYLTEGENVSIKKPSVGRDIHFFQENKMDDKCIVYFKKKLFDLLNKDDDRDERKIPYGEFKSHLYKYEYGSGILMHKDHSIKSGAIGVDMGRNIFQSENPIAMIKAVRGVIHNNFSVSQAYELYEKLSANKAANTNQ